MSQVHVVVFCNLIGTARARYRKLTTLPVDIIRLSPLPPPPPPTPTPHFKERASDGNEAVKISTEESSLYVCPAASRSPRLTC